MRAAWAVAFTAAALFGKAPPGDELLRQRSQTDRPAVAGLRDEDPKRISMSEDDRPAREAAALAEFPAMDPRSDDELHEHDDEPALAPPRNATATLLELVDASFAALAAATKAKVAVVLEVGAAVNQSPEQRKYALYGILAVLGFALLYYLQRCLKLAPAPGHVTTHTEAGRTNMGALARIGALFHRGDSVERRALVRQISQKKQEVAVATALAKKEEVAAAKNHRTSIRKNAPLLQTALANKTEKCEELQVLERQLEQLDNGEVTPDLVLVPDPDARTTTSSTTAGM